MASLDFAGIERIMVDAAMTAWTLGAGTATQAAKRGGVLFADTFEEYGTAPRPPQDAIDFMQRRVPLPLKRLETILEDIKTHSSFLTKDLLDKVSSRIDGMLQEAVEGGISMRDFLRELDEVTKFAGLSKADPWYWETVFRNNIQTAYHAGQEEVMLHPDVVSEFGYFQYYTVGDDRVRPEHAALDGRVWKADDPSVKRFWPPNGHNCRCGMEMLGEDDVKSENLKVSSGAPKLSEGHKRLGLDKPKRDRRVRPDEGWEGLPSKRFELTPPRRGMRAEVKQ